MGVTYQTNEKHLTILPENSVGVVKLAVNRYNNQFVLLIINHYLLIYL